MTTSTLTDAAGRTIREQDHVGGTTSGRYQTTITGPVVQLGKGKAKVRVTNRPTYTGDRPGNADDVWISDDRLFLIHPATERRFVGYRTPDGHVWRQANVQRVLWEAPMVPKRYESTDLRGMYGADLQPVWEDVKARTAERLAAAQARAQAFLEGAALIYDLPQDHELDPGRGDARKLLERLAGEAYTGAYPRTVPWALLMDEGDLIEFLTDLAGVMREADRFATLSGRGQARRILDGLEKTCGTWRAIAEAQHAHNTAPGPDTDTTA
ncbi:hypothetical protein [Streptomyces sp. SAI-127]|uniref:hypothetical protein n=1 Tax=Streptomyces sp. SAI-127 TaxID=2940543 RepID=UPI002475D5E2|nr:hypothetical protein [Streptomyces sp. SAI-127]MDH6489595.1 hypothetical protein [Streptomyces sp. SAI-127]